MAVLLSGRSALEHLRNTRQQFTAPRASNSREVSNNFDAPNAAQKEEAHRMLGEHTEQLFFVVPKIESKRTAPDVFCAIHSRPFPRGSFYQASENVYALSPERIFLQMHEYLSDTAIIDLGYELCGTYTRVGTSHIVHGLPQVSNKLKIKRYLQRCGKERYAKRALKNLGYVNDNSRSLRETGLAMLLCLPTRYGGGGLPEPTLNMPIDVSRLTGIQWRADFRWTDIGWKGARLGIEYDSDEFHSGSEKIARDAERRTLLMAAGYEIIVVTNDQFKRLEEIRRIIAVIYQTLGLRQRWGCGRFFVPSYAAQPSLRRYSSGLSHPSERLILPAR